MRKVSIVVNATWDAEAKVWVATSDDVLGLVAEAPTTETLIKKLQILIPELLELNGLADDGSIDDLLAEVPLIVISETMSKVRLRA